MLEFPGYFRPYLKDFAKRFKPIYDVLKVDIESARLQGNQRKLLDAKKSIVWTDEFQKVLNDTINYLKSPEFLAFPDIGCH